MKKFKGILTGTLLIMTLGMLTACGNNNNAADETGTVTEENDMMAIMRMILRQTTMSMETMRRKLWCRRCCDRQWRYDVRRNRG